MSISDKLPRGIRRLFRLPQSYDRRMRDLDDEIRFHLETHTAQLRDRGLSTDDARAAALARFGSADDLRAYCGDIAARREPGRRVRQWADDLRTDIHFALRQIARAPAFTATTVSILALGIGANAGVFSIVYKTLLNPLPFADGNRMVTLSATSGGGQISITPSADLLTAWQQRSRTVEQVIVFRDVQFVMGDSTRGPTEVVAGAEIPPQAIDFVGVKPLFGRPILPSDTMADAPPVILLGESFWRRAFGASRDVVGRSVMLDRISHTVIGVMPQQFFMPFADGRDAFTAFRHGQTGRANIAKLRPGVTIDDANREVQSLFPPKSEFNVHDDPPRVSRQVDLVGHQRRQMILMLFGAVVIVLLIACANVGNLLLARSLSREREFAVRTALGAGRRRIMRQVLTESMMLAVLAGAAGLGVSFLVLNGIRAALSSGATDFDAVHIGRAAFLWSGGLSLLAGLFFGIGPALSAAGSNAGESLKAGGRPSAGSNSARRLRLGLVVVEVALSVVLLAGAGLLVRTLTKLNRVDVGFQSHGLTSVFLVLRYQHFNDADSRAAAFRAALGGVKAIPGVRGAALASSAPPSFAIGMGGLEIEGRETAPADSLKTFALSAVSPEFFAFAGIPIKAGHTFSSSHAVSEKREYDEFIINEALAKRLWPNGGALGARVRRGTNPFGVIVGIVGDIRLPAEEMKHRLNRDLQVYTRAPSAPYSADLVVRSDLPATTLVPAIKAAVREANPAIAIREVTSADAEIQRQTAGQRSILTLLGAFSLVAVLLAAVGLNGVIAYGVSQRTREIGVRVALGAQPADVARLVLREGFGLALGGVVVGTLAAVAATRALRAFLYGVQPGDPVTLVVVATALLGVAIVASYAPARRAAGLDPVEALRAD